MSLVRLYRRLVKAAAPAPLFQAAAHLHPEKRVDRRGVTQTRWVGERPAEAPHARAPITHPLDRPAPGAWSERPGVTYMVSTSSSLAGAPGLLGVMVNVHTTGVHEGVREGRPWAMDNGAYSGRFEPEKLMDALEKWRGLNSTCRFVVAPDVLGDGPATERLLERWRGVMREMGYPVAFAAHRGTTELPDCDCLFIPAVNLTDPNLPRLIAQARGRGLWIHVGRVNSAQRMRLSATLDADSADGTYVKYRGLERGVHEIADWTRETQGVRHAPVLLTAGSAPQRPGQLPDWTPSQCRDRARLMGDTPLYPPGPAFPPGTPAYHATRYSPSGTLPDGYDGRSATVRLDFGDGRPPEDVPAAHVIVDHGHNPPPTLRAVAGVPERTA